MQDTYGQARESGVRGKQSVQLQRLSSLPWEILETILLLALDRPGFRGLCFLMAHLRAGNVLMQKSLNYIAKEAKKAKIVRQQIISETLSKHWSDTVLNLWILEFVESEFTIESFQHMLPQLNVNEMRWVVKRHPTVLEKSIERATGTAYHNGQLKNLLYLDSEYRKGRVSKIIKHLVRRSGLTASHTPQFVDSLWDFIGEDDDDVCWQLLSRSKRKPNRLLELTDFDNIFRHAWRKLDKRSLRFLSDYTVTGHAETAKSLISDGLLQFEDSDAEKLKCMLNNAWSSYLQQSTSFRVQQLLSEGHFAVGSQLMMAGMEKRDIGKMLDKLPSKKWLTMISILKRDPRLLQQEWHDFSLRITADLIKRGEQCPEEFIEDLVRTIYICIASGKLYERMWFDYLSSDASEGTVVSAFAIACSSDDTRMCGHLLRRRFDCLTRNFLASDVRRLVGAKTSLHKLLIFFSFSELSREECIFLLRVKNNDRNGIRSALKRIPCILQSFHKELLGAAEFLQHRYIFSQLASFDRVKSDFDPYQSSSFLPNLDTCGRGSGSALDPFDDKSVQLLGFRDPFQPVEIQQQLGGSYDGQANHTCETSDHSYWYRIVNSICPGC